MIENTVPLDKFFSKNWPLNLFETKSYNSNEKPLRPSNSRSICCLIFKNVDETVYVGKSSMSLEVGGN